jgi:hypothetical protein
MISFFLQEKSIASAAALRALVAQACLMNFDDAAGVRDFLLTFYETSPNIYDVVCSVPNNLVFSCIFSLEN